MRNGVNIFSKNLIQNNQILKYSQNKLKFGNIGFFFNSITIFTLIQISVNLIKFRLLFRNLFLLTNFLIFWIKLQWNIPIFKKSKNMRMGGGNGDFLSWVTLIRAYDVWLELRFIFFPTLRFYKKSLKRLF